MTDQTKEQLTPEQIRAIAITRASDVVARQYAELAETSRVFASTFRGATDQQRWFVLVPVAMPVFAALCALASEHPAVLAKVKELDEAAAQAAGAPLETGEPS